MHELLQVVEKYLAGEGFTYHRLDETEIKFRYSQGEHTYITHVGVEDGALFFAFTWDRRLMPENIDQVFDVMKQLVIAETKSGRPHVNIKRGIVCSTASVKLQSIKLTPVRFGELLNSILEAFHTMLFVLVQVLDQSMPLDVAVASIGTCDHERIQAMIRELLGQPSIELLPY